jgi:hypothetical protein
MVLEEVKLSWIVGVFLPDYTAPNASRQKSVHHKHKHILVCGQLSSENYVCTISPRFREGFESVWVKLPTSSDEVTGQSGSLLRPEDSKGRQTGSTLSEYRGLRKKCLRTFM